MEKNVWLMMWNKQFWTLCRLHRRSSCFDPYFISEVCKLSIFNLIKTIRIELNDTYDLLQHPPEGMNLKVIHLTRDPRGICSSRQKAENDYDLMKDIPQLCKRMMSDFEASQFFQRQFSNNFLQVRYEDFSRDTFNMTEKLLDFAGLKMSGRIFHHLKYSVNGGAKDEKNLYSTRRNSSSVWQNWKNKLNHEQIQAIQAECGEVMHHLRYRILPNGSNIRTFYPLDN